MNIHLGRLNRIVLVMDRGRGTGEVIDLVHLDKERKGDIMAEKLKVRVPHQVDDISLRPRIEIVDAEDIAAVTKKILVLAEMGPQESGSAGHQNTNVVLIFHFKILSGRAGYDHEDVAVKPQFSKCERVEA
jgi:hypothetical protein